MLQIPFMAALLLHMVSALLLLHRDQSLPKIFIFKGCRGDCSQNSVDWLKVDWGFYSGHATVKLVY